MAKSNCVFLCWSYPENCDEDLDFDLVSNESEAKYWDAYIVVNLPNFTREKRIGKCVGIVPAPKV